MKKTLLLSLLTAASVRAAHVTGIFDKMEQKLTEKERAAAEFEVMHQKNIEQAE